MQLTCSIFLKPIVRRRHYRAQDWDPAENACIAAVTHFERAEARLFIYIFIYIHYNNVGAEWIERPLPYLSPLRRSNQKRNGGKVVVKGYLSFFWVKLSNHNRTVTWYCSSGSGWMYSGYCWLRYSNEPRYEDTQKETKNGWILDWSVSWLVLSLHTKEGGKDALMSEWSWNKELVVELKQRTWPNELDPNAELCSICSFEPEFHICHSSIPQLPGSETYKDFPGLLPFCLLWNPASDVQLQVHSLVEFWTACQVRNPDFCSKRGALK